MPLDGVETAWKPQYRADGSRGPQFALLTCPYTEVFFGGARGSQNHNLIPITTCSTP